MEYSRQLICELRLYILNLEFYPEHNLIWSMLALQNKFKKSCTTERTVSTFPSRSKQSTKQSDHLSLSQYTSTGGESMSWQRMSNSTTTCGDIALFGLLEKSWPIRSHTKQSTKKFATGKLVVRWAAKCKHLESSAHFACTVQWQGFQ